MKVITYIDARKSLKSILEGVVQDADATIIRWQAENQSALDEYNRRIEERGSFSDGLRRF